MRSSLPSDKARHEHHGVLLMVHFILCRIERLRADGRAVFCQNDLFNPHFCAFQQRLAVLFQRLAFFIKRDGFLKRDFAALQSRHDAFKLGQGFFKWQSGQINVTHCTAMKRGDAKFKSRTFQTPVSLATKLHYAPFMHAITISGISDKGDGIAMRDGARFAVPFVLPGETVEIESGDAGRAALVRIIEPSSQRVAPFCPHFTRCGGCTLQHWKKQDYLAWKRNLVIEALRREGIDAPVAPISDAHGAGRRRVTFHLRGTGAKAEAGFMAARSHQLIDLDSCPVLVPELAAATAIARAFWPAIRRYLKPVDVQITATRTGLDVDLRGIGKIEETTHRELARIAQELNLGRLTLHGRLIIETRRPELDLGKAAITPPPGGFLQATQLGEETLAALVLAALPPKTKHAVDLFSGIGPFALRMAERCAVTAIDSDPAAMSALESGVRHASGLKPLKTMIRDLFRNPLSAKEMAGFDAAVFDPPRTGAEAQAKALAGSALKTVIAVSCNTQSFARDASILIAGGYVLHSVTPVDQFAWSHHVEMVGHFKRI
jgi:23S rRNA (uracil1939-C5)-methyltransferase